MSSRLIIIGFVAVWALLMVCSLLASQAVPGPNSLSTEFRRLEVLAIWQIVAGVTAIASAIAAWLQKELSRDMRIVGFIPLGLTLVLAAMVVVAA